MPDDQLTVTLDDADWERLHALRLRGFLPADDESAWAALVAEGFVTISKGRMLLRPEGRDAHARWARATPGPAAEGAEGAYTTFVPLNQRLLKVCHDWQIGRGGVPNDHTDPDYDFKVIARLRDVHGGARRILTGLVVELPRFAGYEAHFDAALEQLDTGDRKWFASPVCDSYHTVWMQFHEDLLLASGHLRAEEEEPQ